MLKNALPQTLILLVLQFSIRLHPTIDHSLIYALIQLLEIQPVTNCIQHYKCKSVYYADRIKYAILDITSSKSSMEKRKIDLYFIFMLTFNCLFFFFNLKPKHLHQTSKTPSAWEDTYILNSLKYLFYNSKSSSFLCCVCIMCVF